MSLAGRVFKLAVCCGIALAAGVAPVRAAQPDVPAAGSILIASPHMPDKDWASAVILIVYSDRQGVMGLLLNRLTEFPLSHLFPEVRTAPSGKDPLYFGGLVASGARAVLRSPRKREGAQRLFGDVAVLFDSAAVEKAARSGLRGDVFRVYAGYAGWSPEQLRSELLLGNWRALPADAAIVFDSHPATLWRRLAGRR
jgi:putative transcriptional regulator